MSKLDELEKLAMDMLKQNDLCDLDDLDVKAWALTMLQLMNGQEYNTDLIQAAHQRVKQLPPPTDEDVKKWRVMSYGVDGEMLI